MTTILPISDDSLYRVGQKLNFTATTNVTTTGWSLSVNSVSLSNSVAEIISQGTDGVTWFCIVKFKTSGTFYLRLINSDNVSITETIYGIDLGWISSRTGNYSDDIGSICSEKINKWSIFKPIRNSNKELANEDIWLYKDTYCDNGAGMKINLWNGYSSSTPFSTFLSNLGSTDAWDYLEPRGSSYKEYYRLGDFRGYTPTKNRVEFEGNSNSWSIYNSSMIKENWDSFSSEENGYNNLNFSDIRISNTLLLSDFYIAVYVYSNTTHRHFIKVLNKLEEQTINISSPIEEIFLNDIITQTNIYGLKEELTRHYFLVNSPKIINQWVEITNTYNSVLCIDYAPGSVGLQYKYLLEIFNNALEIPFTKEIIPIVQNNILISTLTTLIVENQYINNRNIYFKSLVGQDILYKKSETITYGSNKTYTINKIVYEDGIMEFSNLYNSDLLLFDIGYDGLSLKYYRPTTAINDRISINTSDLFDEINEEDWYNTVSKVTYIDENITINFENSASSDLGIYVEFEDAGAFKRLTLSPNNTSTFNNAENYTYQFKNLTEYKFRIHTSSNIKFGDLDTFKVDINSDNRVTLEQINDNNLDHIVLVMYIELGNGVYNNSVNPITISITAIQ